MGTVHGQIGRLRWMRKRVCDERKDDVLHNRIPDHRSDDKIGEMNMQTCIGERK